AERDRLLAARDQRVAELEQAVAGHRAQQTATADVLRAISQSPTDVEDVLDRLVAVAARLCGASLAVITRVEGATLRHAAFRARGRSEAPDPEPEPFPIDRRRLSGHAVLDRRTIQVEDAQAAGDWLPTTAEAALRFGFRTNLAVPLLRDGTPIGVFLLAR